VILNQTLIGPATPFVVAPNMFTDKHVDVWEAVGKMDLLVLGGVEKSVHRYPLLHQADLNLPPLEEGGFVPRVVTKAILSSLPLVDVCSKGGLVTRLYLLHGRFHPLLTVTQDLKVIAIAVV